jgi:hypothetical protein
LGMDSHCQDQMDVKMQTLVHSPSRKLHSNFPSDSGLLGRRNLWVEKGAEHRVKLSGGRGFGEGWISGW